MGRPNPDKVDVGYKFTTNGGEEAVVVEKKSSMEFVIEFLTSGHKQTAHLTNIRSRKIRDNHNDFRFAYKQRFVEKFGDQFDYSNTVYKSKDQPVEIKCNQHSEVFYQTPANHLRGQAGCPQCAAIKRKETVSRGTTEEFRQRSVAVHGCLYDYSLVDYTKNDVEVSIICYRHGLFWQKPTVHWQGCGCPKCAAEVLGLNQRKPQQEWEEECRKIHNGKYDYSKVVYTKAVDKVTIICPEHGEFQQSAIGHLTGRGCRLCAKSGFTPEKRGCVYIFNSPVFTKVGISRNPQQRVAQVSGVSDSRCEIYATYWMSGEDCLKVEQAAHKEIERRGYYHTPLEFHGRTESFVGLSPQEADQIVNSFLKGVVLYG